MPFLLFPTFFFFSTTLCVFPSSEKCIVFTFYVRQALPCSAEKVLSLTTLLLRFTTIRTCSSRRMRPEKKSKAFWKAKKAQSRRETTTTTVTTHIGKKMCSPHTKKSVIVVTHTRKRKGRRNAAKELIPTYRNIHIRIVKAFCEWNVVPNHQCVQEK